MRTFRWGETMPSPPGDLVDAYGGEVFLGVKLHAKGDDADVEPWAWRPPAAEDVESR